MGCGFCFFFFNDTATTEIYTLSLHDALPISFFRLSRETRACRCTSRAAPHHPRRVGPSVPGGGRRRTRRARSRSCGRAAWPWNPPLVSHASNGTSRNRQAKDVVGPQQRPCGVLKVLQLPL